MLVLGGAKEVCEGLSDHSCAELHSHTQLSAPWPAKLSPSRDGAGTSSWPHLASPIRRSGSTSCLGFLRDPGDSFLTENESHTQGQTTSISHSQLSLLFKKR